MTSNQVAKLAGVTLRMLQFWDERGIASPVHFAHRRSYDDVDVWRILVIADLRRRGLSLQQTRQVLPLIRRPGSGYLIRIGDMWRRVDTAAKVVELARTAAGGVIVVELPTLTAFQQEHSQPKPMKTRYRTEFSTYGREAAL